MTSEERQSLTPETLRDSARDLRQQLTAILQNIRQVPGYEQFLALPTFADVRRAIQPDRPLVYLVPTPAGSLALIVTPDTIHDLWLDAINETQLIDLLNQTWFAAYNQSQNNRQGWYDAIDSVTRQLWEPLMAPLVAHLQQHQIQQATLIPTGYLSLLPLHAAWTEDPNTPTQRRYTLNDICIAYAPNAQSLTAAQAISDRVQADSILAIDNPRNDLPNSEREVQAAVSTFPHPTVLRHHQATVDQVRSQLPAANIAHFSCHGTANLNDPLASGLLMSDGLLTLKDIFALNLADHAQGNHGLRLAILSACETGMIGTENADEAISLPTGLLQAGVAAVIASLWAVDDRSTMLLLSKFYDLWRKDNLPPDQALRQAQIWLRDSTAKEIAAYGGFFTPTPDDRPYAHPFHWAAFSYTGI
jgi:CHAT domain-containing protein